MTNADINYKLTPLNISLFFYFLEELNFRIINICS